MNRNYLLKLLVSIAGCQLAGMICGLLTAASVKTWYTTITKPEFNPPNWIFGPVWITLYLMIPYILWVSFATFLNYSIWKLNS